MADTYTDFLNLTRPEIGASRDSWGDKWNANATAIDNWAKIVGPLATNALSKTATGAKQTVASAVAFGSTVDIAGGVELGPQGSAGTAFIDFHSGATLVDFDARIAVTGGDGTTGKGAVAFTGASFGFNSQVTVPVLFISGANNQLSIGSRDATTPAILYSMANTFRIFHGSADTFRHSSDGNIWSSFYGFLSDYVTNKDTAVKSELNARLDSDFFNKTSTTKQSVNSIPEFLANSIDIVRPGVFRARWTVSASAQTILTNGDDATNNIARFGLDGSLWLKQFGDLNDRIEARALAYANDRAATRVNKSGDIMTGDLEIKKDYPNLQLTNNSDVNGFPYIDFADNPRGFGDYAWRLMYRPTIGNEFQFQYAGDGAVKLALRPNGTIYSPAYGEMGTYIDGRVNNKSARMTFAGDQPNTYNQNGSMVEPFAGAVLTSRTIVTNDSKLFWATGRWRYLQMSDAAGNWYTIGYV